MKNLFKDCTFLTWILTHWGRVKHICISNLGYHWFRLWLVACSAPSHYLNRCWHIVDWTFGSKFQWNFYQHLNIFIQENAFEDVVCEITDIFSWPRCVKSLELCGVMMQHCLEGLIQHWLGNGLMLDSTKLFISWNNFNLFMLLSIIFHGLYAMHCSRKIVDFIFKMCLRKNISEMIIFQ